MREVDWLVGGKVVGRLVGTKEFPKTKWWLGW